METNEAIGIAVSIFLTIVVGIIFYMENRLRHYREYLSQYRSKYKKRLGNNQLDATDTGLGAGLSNSNIFDKNINKNLEIMQNTLDKYKIELDNLKNSESFPKEFKFPKRKIVCLCGSTKFKEAFEKANREETAKGNIVLTVAMFGHLEGLDMNSEEKKTFDAVHYDKIELADEVLVLNVDGYIGESAKAEIEYAESLNKEIRYLQGNKNKIYSVAIETLKLEVKDPNSIIDIDLEGVSAYDIGKLLAYTFGESIKRRSTKTEAELKRDNDLLSYANEATASLAYGKLYAEYMDYHYDRKNNRIGNDITKSKEYEIFNKYLNMSILQRKALLAGIIFVLAEKYKGKDYVFIPTTSHYFIEFFKELIKSLNGIVTELAYNINWEYNSFKCFTYTFLNYESRKTVYLCGPSGFKKFFKRVIEEETARGNTVLTSVMHEYSEDSDIDNKEEKVFNALSYNKIELADELLALRVDGCVGEIAKKEIDYAKSLNKTIRYNYFIQSLEKAIINKLKDD